MFFTLASAPAFAQEFDRGKCPDLFASLISAETSNKAELPWVEEKPGKPDFFASKTFDRFKKILGLRYDIEVSGIDEIKARGDQKILFLANHPGPNDPLINIAALGKDFKLAPVMDEGQVKVPVVGKLVYHASQKVGTVLLPRAGQEGIRGRLGSEKAIEKTIAELKNGKNILLYPSGQLTFDGKEDLRNNSMVQRLLQADPSIRIVLLRQEGTWGSSIGRGQTGEVGGPVAMVKGAMWNLLNGIFFMPKRKVHITLKEPEDFPRTADRSTMNRYMESFFNEKPVKNLYVPYHFLDRRGVRELPPPPSAIKKVATVVEEDHTPLDISDKDRAKVIDKLKAVTKLDTIKESDEFANLGLESLETMEFVTWLEGEFERPIPELEKIKTVRDVLKAVSGPAPAKDAAGSGSIQASKQWVKQLAKSKPLQAPKGQTITEAFLEQARLNPDKVIAEDALSGPVTYRKLITAINLFKPIIEKMKGDKIGIMLPPGVGNTSFYMATLFAGKTPVMINFTAGEDAIKASVDKLGVDSIITAGKFVDKLAQENRRTNSVERKFVFVEDLKESLSGTDMAKALAKSYWSWKDLDQVKPTNEAVILFTSGSSGDPKIVPLTHENVMTNVTDVMKSFAIKGDDRIMGFLPPFHSFGNVQMAMSLTQGIPTVYHSNATEGRVIAQHVAAYKPTIVMGTPTFLKDIFAKGKPEQLGSLKIGVTGAEQLTDAHVETISKVNPNMNIYEGYGLTEASPVVAVNTPEGNKRGTVGKILPALEHKLVDPETGVEVPKGSEGVLMVRGKSIFGGYMHGKPEDSPFRSLAGQDDWYYTGDIVKIDDEGFVTIVGRLSRFTKKAGEMVSLNRIEKAISTLFLDEPAAAVKGAPAPGPAFAVETAGDNQPTVLFSTRPIDLELVRETIKAKGMPKTQSIDRVVLVKEIPVLGTGKTDYKVLKKMLKDEGSVGEAAKGQ